MTFAHRRRVWRLSVRLVRWCFGDYDRPVDMDALNALVDAEERRAAS